jgi:lanosterol synthase
MPANEPREAAAARTPRDAAAVAEALNKAWRHLEAQQHERGCWQGEVEWCSMITSQVVIARHVVGAPPSPEDADAIIRYLRGEQRPDGSFGMHPSSQGFLFTTVLAYVALRLLGLPASDPTAAAALVWIRAQGGPLAIPTWGKIWLAVLGLYGWDGVNPVPPELWLLPESVPAHPSRWYCHTRLIYLPIGYLWATRFRAPGSPLLSELRDELYGGVGAFRRVRFGALRHRLASSDVYDRPGPLLRRAYDVAAIANRFAPKPLRARALQRSLALIEGELVATRYACISPVNGLLNLLAIYASNAHHPAIPQIIEALRIWRWEDERGARYAGACSQTWDTAFVAQAALAGPLERAAGPSLSGAHAFFQATQLRTELSEPAALYREPRAGGWCFSDDYHQWPVSDTTAEALTALLEIEERGYAAQPLERARVEAAVQFILRRQNPDGGFGSYEPRRGPLLLDHINPSEMFGSCMTERSYTECAASCVKALAVFAKKRPQWVTSEVRSAIAAGVAFLRSRQEANGSWAAVWAVNYTYGTLFAVEALLAAGVSPADSAIRRAVEWTKRVQRADGSWGEHWSSCLQHTFVEHALGQCSMTAWALMTLCLAGDARSDAAKRGAAWLVSHQLPSGAWPRQDVAGVFFHTAMLEYALYKDIFPTWALSLYAQAHSERSPA